MAEETLPALSFQDLVELHDDLKSVPFFEGMDLPKFSRFMKEQSGTAMFDAGLSDSKIKRASLAVDRFLQPVARQVGHAAGSLSESVGLGEYRPMIERVGESIPRSLAELVPVVAGAAMLPTPAAPLGVGLMAAGAGSAGAKTYTDTGSGLAGLITGAATAAVPGAASLARKTLAAPLINKFFTKEVAEKIGQLGGEALVREPLFTSAKVGAVGAGVAALAERGVEWAAENLGVTMLNEAAGQAASAAAGEGLYNPLTAEHAVEMAAGTLPFAAVDAALHLHGRLTKDFTSQTARENASYVGQVREAQQLADTADMINRFRKTEMRSQKPLALPAPGESSYRPDLLEAPKYGEGMGPAGPRIFRPEPGPFDPALMKQRDLSEIEQQLHEARRLVDEGVLTPVEGAQRIENIQKLPVEGGDTSGQGQTGQKVEQQGGQQKGERQAGVNVEGQGSAIRGVEAKPVVPPLKAGSPESQTLQPSATGFAAQIGAKEFFTKKFKEMGLSESEVERNTQIAERIAAAYSDVGYTRVGELVRSDVRGTYWRNTDNETLNAFVGLVQTGGFKNQELAIFKAFHTLGHEMWHGIQRDAEQARLDPVKTYQYNKLAEMSAGMTPEERSDMLAHTWSMMIPEKFHQDSEFRKVLEHRAGVAGESHTEFMADMAGSFVLGLVSPDGLSRTGFIKEELRFSTPLEQQFARAMYVPLRDIAKSVHEWEVYSRKNPGTDLSYPGANLPSGGQFFTNLVDKVESILKDSAFIDRATQALADIEKNDPVYFEQLRANALVSGPIKFKTGLMSKLRKRAIEGSTSELNDATKVAKKFLGLDKKQEMEKELGLQPGFLRKWFFPFAQLSAEYPQLLGIHNIVRSYSAMANDFLTDLMAPFMSKTNKMGHVSIDPEAHNLKAVASSPKEMDALNRVRLISNEVSKEEKRELTDGEVKAALPSGLSIEEQGRVTDLFRTLTRHVYPKAAEVQVLAAGAKVSHAAAAVMMGKNPALKWKDALSLGTGVRDLVIASNDPLQAAAVQQKLAYLQQVAGPQAVQSAIEVAKPMLAEVQKLEKLFRENPGYSPETRLGQYLVLWKRPGSKEWGSFASDDFNQAKAKLDKIRGEGVDKAFMRDKYDKHQTAAGMDPDIVERYSAIDSAAFNAALKQLGESTEELQRFREMYSPGDAVAKEIKSRGIKQFLLPRKLTEGREDTNAILGMLDYVSGVAHGVAKGYTREQAGLAFMDAELKRNPKLLDLARKHLNNVINPSASELTALKQLNFAYFLGFNFSSMLIEGSQGVMTLVPQLTRDTGSISSGYKTWGSAVKQWGHYALHGKLENAETQVALERAVKEGRVDAGVMQEFNTLEENLIPNLRSLASGQSPLEKVGELVKRPAYWYLHAARWMYSWAPRANSQVAFVAAFDIARGKLKMGAEQAYDYAVTTVDRTMFGGGKAGRPVELFANTGKLQGVVGLMYSLQTYTFSTISMMARLGKEAIGSSDRLTPTEKSAARKAFGQMLATQIALGGALSLPMSAGLLALVEQLFPESEARRKVRDAVQTTLGGTDGLSGFLSDVALKGLPDAVGLDLSSRVGLSSLLGVNPYSGFQVGNLVGPIGSVVENIAKSARSASQGEFAQAARNILPTPYRNVLQLAQDGGQVKAPNGQLLYQPTDVEKILMSVGFRPSSVSDRQEAQGVIARSEDVERARLARFHKGQVELLLNGEPGQVRENLLNYAKENSLYDPRAGARAVVELAQQATNPVDLSRSGVRTSAVQRQQIGSSYHLPQDSTEQQLLLQKKSLERTLQIPGAGRLNPSELVLARTVDYLRSVDPSLPPAQAKRQAEAMLGRGLGPRL